MSNQENILLIICCVCLVIFLTWIIINENKNIKEGLTATIEIPQKSTSQTGIGNNISSYINDITAQTNKLKDELNISSYKNEYEVAIISMDDLLNNIMLKTILNNDSNNNSDNKFKKIAELNQSKNALNSIMKFISEN